MRNVLQALVALPVASLALLSVGCGQAAPPPVTTARIPAPAPGPSPSVVTAVMAPIDPGFTEAFFGKTDLDVLRGGRTDGYFHFYNVMLNAKTGVGSVAAMAADATHKERYSYATGPWYRLYFALNGSSVRCDTISEEGALERIRQIRNAGLTDYAAVFTVQEVLNMFTIKGCNAVKLTPARTTDGRYWTMTLTPVKVQGGVATEVGDRNSVTCSEPCPVYCGNDPLYFLNTH